MSIRITIRAAVLAAAVALPAAGAAFGQVPCAGAVADTGQATWYDYPGSGACSFGTVYGDTMVAAINDTQFEGSAMCGRWVRVTGPQGSVDVCIVDMCPTCPAGDLDLDRNAFTRIADLVDGRVPIAWETIAAPDTAAVSIYVDPSSNPYYLAVQVRHHRYGVATVEYLAPSGYVTVPRTMYNMFPVSSTLGVPVPVSDPATFRVTDVNGQSLVVTGIALSPGAEFSSGQQFPVCTDPRSGVVPDAGFALLAPAPNPFNPRTTIAFDLPRHGPARVRVFDAQGRLVAVLLDDTDMPRGRSEVTWDGRDSAGRRVPSGVYLCRLDAGDLHATRKLALLQ